MAQDNTWGTPGSVVTIQLTWSIGNDAILWAEPQVVSCHMRLRPQVDLPGIIRSGDWPLQACCWSHKVQHFHDEANIQHQGRSLEPDLGSTHTDREMALMLGHGCCNVCTQTECGGMLCDV